MKPFAQKTISRPLRPVYRGHIWYGRRFAHVLFNQHDEGTAITVEASQIQGFGAIIDIDTPKGVRSFIRTRVVTDDEGDVRYWEYRSTNPKARCQKLTVFND